MALSPLDIKNKTFPVKMRGYNPDEVDDFIDQVIGDYEDVLADRRELEKALKHAEEKLTYFNELKDALNQSIIVAQDTADKVKESAVRESDLLLSAANAEAKEIIAKANAARDELLKDANRQAQDTVATSSESATKISSKSDELRKQTREYHRSLTLLLESQLEIVKSQDWKDLLSSSFKHDELARDLEEEIAVEKVERELPVQEELAELIGKVYEPEATEATEVTEVAESTDEDDYYEEYYEEYYEYYVDDEETTTKTPLEATPAPVVEEVAEVETPVAADVEVIEEVVVTPTPEVVEKEPLKPTRGPIDRKRRKKS